MPETDESTVQQILKEYDAGFSLFGDFRASCERLVAELLRLEGVTVHSVHARVKERPRLQEKLGREGKNYRSLKDVTDIIGVRVITHFEDEVDKIGALIEREFVIDTDKSVDKRKLLDPDRFGYLSLHYICSLSQDRIRLAENRRFRELACEIQIRSILQHAWAEIEHDLGYKSGHGIPSPIRRRFSRLAGLLEVADEEFAAIRNDLADYESKIKTEITTVPEEVGIDKISLKVTFEQNDFIRELENQLAKDLGTKIDDDNDALLTILSPILLGIGINTVQQLVEALKTNKDLLVFQSKKRKRRTMFMRGTSALTLPWVLMGLRSGEESILLGLEQFGVQTVDGNDNFAKELMVAIREFQSTSTPKTKD